MSLPSLFVPPALKVLPESTVWLDKARQLAEQLNTSVLDPEQDAEQQEPGLLLLVGDSGLRLQTAGPKAPGPTSVDFLAGAVAHRRRFGGGSGQQIAKAVGIKPGIRPWVADVTAGLGRDSFVLASLGCRVEMVERSLLIALLLEDGLQRARLDAEVGPIVSRMTLHAQEGVCWLNTLSEIERPDVIYVDPMFPHSEKRALVKKEMRLFREVVGDDGDAEALLAAALEQARFRVVVKRPRKAPCLGGQKPGYQLEGKSGRFDIYPLKAMTPGLV